MKVFKIQRGTLVETLSVQVSIDMNELLKDLAKRHELMKSEVVRQMVQHCLDNLEDLE